MLCRREFVRAVAALCALPAMGCAARPEERRTTVFAFDTVCVLSGVMSQEVLDEARGLCERFEQLFSRTRATSDVGRINAAAGEPVTVDPHTADLLQKSLSYCEASDGLFDITIGAVSELWDFTEGVVASERAIAEALPHVGWRNVQVEGTDVRLKDPAARIDLGGIAKGYIADAIVDLLRERGVTSASVNLGGNVAVLGAKANGEPWNVGVRDPASEVESACVAKVRATGGSVVTSGLYERSFQKDGKRYWHILDPRTGYPVQTDLASASIFCERSIDGDGNTKPLFMWGAHEAIHRLERMPDLQALLITDGGETLATSNSTFEPM